MIRKFITPSLLILVAVLSWWHIRNLEKGLSRPPADLTQGPDYFMYGTVSTLMDETGEPRHRLQTAYLAHFSQTNQTELTEAHLTFHQRDGSLWVIKANRGTVFQETEQIQLAGDVVIERPPQDTVVPERAQDILSAGIKIKTDRLHIDPNGQIAQTEDPVTISAEDARVNAVGMKANLQTKTVELLANVRGIYAQDR